MKKLWILVMAGVAVAGLVSGNQRNASGQEEPRPNILVIVTDDQRARGLNRFLPETMRWLRGKGTIYPNAYASTPLCCPSRASILTGRYAHNHGVHSNGGGEEPSREALDHDTTMQAYLLEAGYRTGIVGKLFNRWPLRKDPPYWDYFAIFKKMVYRPYYWNINGKVDWVSTYSTKFVGNKAVEFIRRSENDDAQPWMLYVAPLAPHTPWDAQRLYEGAPVGTWSGNPAVQERDRSDKPPWLQDGCHLECARQIRAGQARLIMSADDLILRLRQKLKRFGETDTLVIYISDNGYLWGEHGLAGKSQPYAQSARVPLMMRWPGHTEPGRIDERLALNIDIAPTVLEAARVPIADTPMDGRSLLVDPARNRVHLEHWCTTRECDRWAATQTAAYQYVERYGAEGNVRFREYYDIVADPWQTTNLLKDGDPSNNPDVATLDAQLEPDRSCVGGLCP